MTPVFQTIDNAVNGNCMAACLASIIGNDIDGYPDLPNDSSWYPIMNGYLNSIGWNMVTCEGIRDFALKGYYLMCGYNEQSRCGHCVVCYSGDVVHDPSRKRQDNPMPLKNVYYGILYEIISK